MDNKGSMTTDWAKCAEVERVRGRFSGALTFRDSRMAVANLISNLATGATVEEWAEWYGGDLDMARAILEFLAEDLSQPWTEPPANKEIDTNSAGVVATRPCSLHVVRILFDHGTPDGLANLLEGHEVDLARARGWARLTNGELLRVAEDEGFELLITTDSNIRYQQNLSRFSIAILLVHPPDWNVQKDHIEEIITATNTMQPGQYRELRF